MEERREDASNIDSASGSDSDQISNSVCILRESEGGRPKRWPLKSRQSCSRAPTTWPNEAAVCCGAWVQLRCPRMRRLRGPPENQPRQDPTSGHFAENRPAPAGRTSQEFFAPSHPATIHRPPAEGTELFQRL